MIAEANAKINLTLAIKSKRPDGYHEVEMVMQTVTLHDTVTVETAESGIVCSSDRAGLPSDAANTAGRAAAAFFKAAGLPDAGARIQLQKRIPMAAGLAGGSADAAAVILCLDKLYHTGFSRQTLEEIALQTGCDVPFCLWGGTKLAAGAGGRLSPMPPMPDCPIVIAKPSEGVSTAEAYARYDRAPAARQPDNAAMARALAGGRLINIAGCFYNVFEESLRLTEVKKIKACMLGYNAVGAAMSGSGPSVFGVFARQEDAARCAESLKSSYEEVFLCRPSSFGVKLQNN